MKYSKVFLYAIKMAENHKRENAGFSGEDRILLEIIKAAGMPVELMAGYLHLAPDDAMLQEVFDLNSVLKEVPAEDIICLLYTSSEKEKQRFLEEARTMVLASSKNLCFSFSEDVYKRQIISSAGTSFNTLFKSKTSCSIASSGAKCRYPAISSTGIPAALIISRRIRSSPLNPAFSLL